MAIYNAISNQVLTTTGTPTFNTLSLTNPLGANYGGTGVANGVGSTITLAGPLVISGPYSSTFTMTNTTSVTFPTTGTLATTSQLPSPAALTASNDTNVTLTLGGTPATALLQASSITAGWTGQLSPSRGGTGVNNTGTITVGGNTAFSGAFTFTGALTGNTSVTFPTSGTLATTAGTVSSITGTANQVIASSPTGAVTLSLPQSIGTGNSPTFLGLTAGNLNLSGNTIISTDTNGNITLTPNGTGLTAISSNIQVVSGNDMRFSSGNKVLSFQDIASATSWLQVANSLSNTPSIQAMGSGTNVSLELTPKGTGAVFVSGTTTAAGSIQLLENSTNGTDRVTLSAPSSVTTSYTLTYPAAAPTVNNMFMSSTTAGTMSWNNLESNISFTPVLFGSVVAGSPTGTFNGLYSRTGNRVFVNIYIVISSLGGMDGEIRIGGLPYQVASSGAVGRSSAAVGFKSGFANEFYVTGLLLSDSDFRLYNAEINNTAVMAGDMSNSTTFYLSFNYICT